MRLVISLKSAFRQKLSNSVCTIPNFNILSRLGNRRRALSIFSASLAVFMSGSLSGLFYAHHEMQENMYVSSRRLTLADKQKKIKRIKKIKAESRCPQNPKKTKSNSPKKKNDC